METKTIIGFLVGIIILVWGIAFIASKSTSTAEASPYDTDALAQCLTEHGAKFYGAFWCPHCQATKKLFGEAKAKLPYIECSTADSNGQLQICKDKQIEGYPTWIFADGTRLVGELTASPVPPPGTMSFNQLAAAGSCPLIIKATGEIVPVASSTTETASSTETSATSSINTGASSAAR